jgi:GGDEF domain-containing protein
LIAQLRYNATLRMLNASGTDEAIRTLRTDTTYTVALCDIDRLKLINAVTGNHLQTDRYLAAGLAVRAGEIAGQLHDRGDEFLFILDEQSRHEDADPDAFVARITRQLAGQPLTISERYALAAARGCHVADARLSATFAVQSGVSAGDVMTTIESLSQQVLAQKKERDAR